MIRVSCKLYDVVNEAFGEYVRRDHAQQPVGFASRNSARQEKWQNHLKKMKVQEEYVWEPTDDTAETIKNVMALLDGDSASDEDFVACADPSNTQADGSILIFPKTLADKIMALGYFPIPEEET